MEHYFIVLKEDEASNISGANQFPLGRGARGGRGARSVQGFARGRFVASSGRKRRPESSVGVSVPAKKRSDSAQASQSSSGSVPASGASVALEK